MKFYSELSRVYDIVFPIDENTLNFLAKGIKVNGYVLDLACGTGDFTIALGKKGYNVIGVDLNHGMIEQARNKLPQGLNVKFIEGDMTKLSITNGEKQDLIFCIGNSIVHLNEKGEIQNFIKAIYDNLGSGGKAVIQTINFNRIVKYKIDALPTITKEAGDIQFIRNYIYNEGDQVLDFSTELVVKEDGIENKYVNKVPLIILLKNELYEMFQKAGFGEINIFGGFDRSNYSDESYALVIEGKKL